jgi:tripartite-type tricarboxylate transporter receptor subunit TctC
MFKRTFAGVGASAFALSAALVLTAATADAQSTGALAGKTVQVIIGYGPGGGFDQWGRTLARHIGDHLPGNPTVVAENMPGAGSYLAASYIYSVAAKDGTVMALIDPTAVLGPLTGANGARFDPTKMSWLGTTTRDTPVCIASGAAEVKTAADLFTKQLIMGDNGAGSTTHSYPAALAGLIGMKFKLIAGFPASADVLLAMDRGEVEGICESLESLAKMRPDWFSSGKARVLFQGATAQNPDLKNVPNILDYAHNDEDKQAITFLYAGQSLGRPFVAPPGMTPDNLKMLRDAFDATMKDAAFIADAKQQKLDVKPDSGANIAGLVDQIYATPKPIVEKVGKLIQ